ncbi:MAG: hypothetical protein IJ062_08165 [Firmicutes bacterium]|nr:hypothetical protein [Bacillota bacterium]
MQKRKKYQKKPFESVGNKSDTSANIYMSMLMSPAWMDLTPRQQVLYLYAKSRFYGQRTADKKALFNQFEGLETPKYIDPFFSLSVWEVTEQLKIYSKSNLMTFYRDLEQLILHGFIKCVACQSSNRPKKRSIYTYSDKWQLWGTESFNIEPAEMTRAMIKKYSNTNFSNSSTAE